MRLAVVTGTRAEYGLLRPLLHRIQEAEDMELQFIVTGAHLSEAYGSTIQEILADGFEPAALVDMKLGDDSEEGTVRSMALGLTGMGEVLARRKPDLLILLGDRYEMLAAAEAAVLTRVPIAHIHGGETTEGAMDEAFRHAITKMSYLHFTSCEAYRQRVIQLGEAPDRVFVSGAMAVETIQKVMLEAASKESLEAGLGWKLDGQYCLLTYHPATLADSNAAEDLTVVLEALSSYPFIQVLITKANADPGGLAVNQVIDEFVKEHPQQAKAYSSLGQQRYLKAMKHCSFVIGNSSSGILEAPCFGKPSIDIGSRQKGRIKAESTISCDPIYEDVCAGIEKALTEEFKIYCSEVNNPYGNGTASERILEIIRDFHDNNKIQLSKTFYCLV